MTEMATIYAAAKVILKLCEDQGDMQTKLERVSYAAVIIQREAVVGLEKINSAAEVTHG
jgi:hypothetical protein